MINDDKAPRADGFLAYVLNLPGESCDITLLEHY